MMAAMILVFSVATLLMFFISYCRSLTAAHSRKTLSEEVRDVTGIHAGVPSQEYARVIQLLKLCPERPEDRGGLRAVQTYYDLLRFLQVTVAKLAPSLKAWTASELAGCTYFAAVALDRRISFSREMLSRQAES
jgi:hypothetical protein